MHGRGEAEDMMWTCRTCCHVDFDRSVGVLKHGWMWADAMYLLPDCV
jgi:hypothetical protein